MSETTITATTIASDMGTFQISAVDSMGTAGVTEGMTSWYFSVGQHVKVQGYVPMTYTPVGPPELNPLCRERQPGDSFVILPTPTADAKTVALEGAVLVKDKQIAEQQEMIAAMRQQLQNYYTEFANNRQHSQARDKEVAYLREKVRARSNKECEDILYLQKKLKEALGIKPEHLKANWGSETDKRLETLGSTLNPDLAPGSFIKDGKLNGEGPSIYAGDSTGDDVARDATSRDTYWK